MSAVMVSMAVLIRTFNSGIHTHPSLETAHTNFKLNFYVWLLFLEFGAELPLDNLTPTMNLNNPHFRCKIIEDNVIYLSWRQSDRVEMKVRLCARPNVREFLCSVWEIAILMEGRVNMNSAIEETRFIPRVAK